VIPIDLPPLRKREGDVALLCEYFLARNCQKMGLPPKIIAAKTMELLIKYKWPGNVRELENAIERAVVISKNQELKSSDFPPEIISGVAPASGVLEPGMSINEAEKILILKTLKAEHGNKTKAAEILGISARTLRNKLQEYGLTESD
jgi:DNA-binding NtrC family response regulator